MAKYYSVNGDAILSSEIWPEATKDELRVLTYIIAKGGEVESTKALATACGISSPRARSAISLWCDAGVLTEGEGKLDAAIDLVREPKVTYEFPINDFDSDTTEKTGVEIAEVLRNSNLTDLYESFAELLGQPTLNRPNQQILATLYTDWGASPDYLITLAQYLCDKSGPNNPFAMQKFKNKVIRLCKDGIDNIELLEKYIEDQSKATAYDYDFKKVIAMKSLWDRTLSESERGFARRWFEFFGYDAVIIGLARECSITRKGKVIIKYMDKCLETWYNASLRTVDEVKAFESKYSSIENEYKRIIGGDIWERPMTSTELDYCIKWWTTFSFSTDVVEYAASVSTEDKRKISPKYMDALLQSWYDAGCRSLEDAKKHVAQYGSTKKRATKRGEEETRTEEGKLIPKYTNFTAEEALLRALERSYSEEK